MDVFLTSQPRAVDYPSAWARSARVALVALVAPPALLGVASAAGYPLRAGVEIVTWTGALVGFAGAGWLAARQTRQRSRDALVVTAGSLVTGVCVTPAFRGLRGLSGHEPVIVVCAATLGAFAAGFGLGGAIAAIGVGVATARVPRTGAACALAGSAGGALVLLPYAWSLLDIRFQGDSYLRMALAVFGFLGCVIVPSRWIGVLLAGQMTDKLTNVLDGHRMPHSQVDDRGAELTRQRPPSTASSAVGRGDPWKGES